MTRERRVGCDNGRRVVVYYGGILRTDWLMDHIMVMMMMMVTLSWQAGHAQSCIASHRFAVVLVTVPQRDSGEWERVYTPWRLRKYSISKEHNHQHTLWSWHGSQPWLPLLLLYQMNNDNHHYWRSQWRYDSDEQAMYSKVVTASSSLVYWLALARLYACWWVLPYHSASWFHYWRLHV